MAWQPPDAWTEVQGQLKQSGQVTLDANGNGVLIFSPWNARMRWVVSSVVVTTNQAANAMVVPIAVLAINTNDLLTMSQGNQRGSSWSGNQDTFQGTVDVGAMDNLSVIFAPPPQQAGAAAALAGVIASAVVQGVYYVRRG